MLSIHSLTKGATKMLWYKWHYKSGYFYNRQLVNVLWRSVRLLRGKWKLIDFFMRKREATCNSKYLLKYLLTENLYYRSFSWRYLPYVELYWATLEKKKRKKEKERKKPLDFVTNYFVYLSWWIRPCYEYYSCILMLSVPLWNITIFIFIPNPFQATTSPVFALSIERH